MYILLFLFFLFPFSFVWMLYAALPICPVWYTTIRREAERAAQNVKTEWNMNAEWKVSPLLTNSRC